MLQSTLWTANVIRSVEKAYQIVKRECPQVTLAGFVISYHAGLRKAGEM